MNELEKLIYNEGERLIPYVTHDQDELIRHRSSYVFFYNIICQDQHAYPIDPIRIVDLGFGSGYGCALLSSIPKSKITGVDISPECEIYASRFFKRFNVNYQIDDLLNYIPNMPTHDYVVSRGVLEHVSNGLDLINHIKFNRRVIIDVPYNEAPTNPHHLLTGIKEDSFASIPNCEIFYEDLNGRIYSSDQKPDKPNMILIVISSPELPKISTCFNFPISGIEDNYHELLSVETSGKSYDYLSSVELFNSIDNHIKKTETVLDIGCGIRPMSYFKPKLHLHADPCQQYVDLLTFQNYGDKSTIVLKSYANEILETLGDNSVDSIFLLDVIEHIDKEVGLRIIKECERVAREQIVIFTPLGFMPQTPDENGKDAWGLSGGDFQLHRSGWTPEDFSSNWDFHICSEFHTLKTNDDTEEKVYGVFFAIRNFDKKAATPQVIYQIYRSLSSLRMMQKYSTKKKLCYTKKIQF